MTEINTDQLLKAKKVPAVQPSDYLSTGSTVLNLACTGKTIGGFIKGHYYYFVGDSSSGKTWLALTCFAEAVLNPSFNDHRLIYDNAEDGAMMDWVRFFGKKMARRVEPPSRSKDRTPVHSETIEDFYFHLDDAKEAGKPFIYVMDSMDALSSDDEQETVQKQKKAYRANKEMPGSYGDGKAKRNSSGVRQILSYLRKSGSILIILSQTRESLAKFTMDKKTRSGGKALTFYATLEMWSSQAGHIKKNVNDKTRELGIYSQVRVKKNRIVGKDRTVTIPIYHSYGIDDVGSCIDYLLEEGHWKKAKGKINAKELDFIGSREQIVHHVEENGIQRDLQMVVSEVWASIEEQCAIKRLKRYD